MAVRQTPSKFPRRLTLTDVGLELTDRQLLVLNTERTGTNASSINDIEFYAMEAFLFSSKRKVFIYHIFA